MDYKSRTQVIVGALAAGETASYFNWKPILLPREIVEYVVVQGLIHAHEPHHTPQFWKRVERVLPD